MSESALISRRPIFKGRVVDLSVDRIRLPSGRVTELEVIRHPGAVAIVPLTEDREVLLVRQYRHAAGGWILEVPAGKLDPGEEPEICARRELEEEVGFRPGSLRQLGEILTTPGFTDEKIALFLATDLRPGRQDLQQDEELSVVQLPFAEALDGIEKGDIRDAKSICALMLAASAMDG